jgi:hypothetical protein
MGFAAGGAVGEVWFDMLTMRALAGPAQKSRAKRAAYAPAEVPHGVPAEPDLGCKFALPGNLPRLTSSLAQGRAPEFPELGTDNIILNIGIFLAQSLTS